MKKVLCIISGGMDSITMLYKYLKDGAEVTAISFDYGQRHKKEIEFARLHCEENGVHLEVCDLSSLTGLISRSSLTNPDIPVPFGHYEAKSMKATVVPNRNMIMISVAAGYAITIECDRLAYGAHSGDHAVYADCRPAFADALGEAIDLCDYSDLKLERPFIDIDKTEVARIGSGLGLDYSATWSCYVGDDIHCGKCGTCVERREALRDAGIEDLTRYADDATPLNEVLNA